MVANSDVGYEYERRRLAVSAYPAVHWLVACETVLVASVVSLALSL